MLSNKEVNIQFAREDECGIILGLIKGLARHEKKEYEVAATEEQIRQTIFKDKEAEVLLAECNGNVVGFALFFHSYSTYLGKPRLYLEDLFVKEEMRSKGIGTMFFKALAEISRKRDYGRMEWCCLDWNRESIDFYLHLGAKVIDDKRLYRITEDQFDRI